MSDYDDANDEQPDDYKDSLRKAASSGAPDPEQSIWDSDDALNSLVMERSVHPTETNEQMTKRLIEEAGPLAAQSIIHIALHSQNDNTRLAAAKYITDKVYDDDSTAAKAPWEDLVADVVSKAELLANSPQNPGRG